MSRSCSSRLKRRARKNLTKQLVQLFPTSKTALNSPTQRSQPADKATPRQSVQQIEPTALPVKKDTTKRTDSKIAVESGNEDQAKERVSRHP